MDMSDPDLLQIRRGPLDGQKFFCSSPFRSLRFLLASAACLGGMSYALRLYWHWQRLWPSVSWIFVPVAVGLGGTWLVAYRYIGRVRNLYSEGLIGNVEPGSPVDVLLGIAAGVINETLFPWFAIVILLLGLAEYLLTHACR
jgi:hypothetical protein